MRRNDDYYREKIRTKAIVADNGCWNWPGFLHPLRGAKDQSTGYGAINYHSESWRAHRLSYALFKGPIPEGQIVRHKCDNPRCVNPDHLEIGTHQQNMDDMNSKGRNGYSRKTHCPAGHDYETHGYLWKTGRGTGIGRACRTCNRIRQRIKSGWTPEEAKADTGPIPQNSPTPRRWATKRPALTKCEGQS